MNTPDRRKLIAQIHMGAARLFGDIAPNGTGRADYEAWLKQQAGSASCRACSDAQLARAVADLRAQGALDARPKAAAGQGPDRPTPKQWAALAAAARARGWDGPDDGRLVAFVVRTAKVASPRFLSRRAMSKVIQGLKEWAAQDQKAAG